MTETHREVDPPYAKRSLQLTVAVLVFIACGWQVVTLVRVVGRPQHAIAGGSQPLIQIDLNLAGPQELTLLPGVGPVLARRIVEDRERIGRFESLDDLSRVQGIGTKTIQQIERIGFVERPPPLEEQFQASDQVRDQAAKW